MQNHPEDPADSETPDPNVCDPNVSDPISGNVAEPSVDDSSSPPLAKSDQPSTVGTTASDDGGENSDANPMVSQSRSVRPMGLETAKRLAAAAAQVAVDNKGGDVMVLDVTAQSAEFDFFVLATGQSRRQLHAISEQIDDVLEKELGDRRLGIEGYAESRWIVLDYGNLVVHLFDDETREYYDLETLWADAKPISLDELGVKDSSRH